MGTLTAAEKRKVRKPLLWVGLASIVMTFAGLTSGYIVSRSALSVDNRWLEFALPPEFYWSTVVIFISSLTMVWAKSEATKGSKNVRLAVGITLFLGLAFTLLQLLGVKDLIDRGLYLIGGSTSISWVYVIAGLHWLHIISGLIVLIVTFIRASNGAYTAEDHHGLDISATYWHFLDGLWLLLFLFMVFIR